MGNAEQPFKPDKNGRPPNIRKIMASPQQGITRAAARSDRYRSGEQHGVSIPIAGIRETFGQLLPGEVCAVIAQTSNFKTRFLHFMESEHIKRLKAEGKDNHIVVHVSTEETNEEFYMLDISFASGVPVREISRGGYRESESAQAASMKLLESPIYAIGNYLDELEEAPSLNLTNVQHALNEYLDSYHDYSPTFAAIFFDYLQAFPLDPEILSSIQEGKRRLQVRQDIYRIREIAQKYGCPVFVAVQAKQRLEGANPPLMLPGVYDGEESSSIAQRCDAVLSLWMPKSTHLLGSRIDTGLFSFTVDKDLLCIKIAKNRNEESGQIFMCRVDFKTNMITRID